MTLPGSRYWATEIGLIMNTGLIARIAVPASLMSCRIGLCLLFFSISRRTTAISPPAAVRGDRVVVGGRHLAARHLDPRLVQGTEILDPLSWTARRTPRVAVTAENVADQRLVIRDLEVVDCRAGEGTTFLDAAATIAPKPGFSRRRRRIW